MHTYRFFCRDHRPCGTFRARFLLEAAHAFARSRGFAPQDVNWLATRMLLGGLWFDIEVEA